MATQPTPNSGNWLTKIWHKQPVEPVTVCYCFDIDDLTIQKTIKKKRLCTVEQVGECLDAGTHCGSCLEKITELLADRAGK